MKFSEEYNAPIFKANNEGLCPLETRATTLEATLCNNSDNASMKFPNSSYYSHTGSCFRFSLLLSFLNVLHRCHLLKRTKIFWFSLHNYEELLRMLTLWSYGILGHYSGRPAPTFRRNLLPPSVQRRRRRYISQKFYVYGSVHRWSILIIVQRDATQNSLFTILQIHSTCFGCQTHSSSGVHKTVTTASVTGHIMTSNGGCSYSFVYSWWWVWLTPETCRVNLQNNK